MYKTVSDVIFGGLTLVRHYDDTKGTIDKQCGSLVQWNQWLQEMSVGLEYYNFGGKNKFFSKVTVNSFSLDIPFPNQSYAEAYCQDKGNGYSEISLRFFEDLNRLKGAISHEMGHSYHDWCECLYGNVFANEFNPFFERQISINGTTSAAKAFPWDTGENSIEQFANAWRCYFGTNGERGSSGPGTDDYIRPGFKDPKLNQGWCTQMKLLPETSAMVKKYGIKPNTLSWPYGDYGGFVFRTNEWWPRWVCHWFDNSNFAVWYELKNNTWVRFYPEYNRT